ncbi:MAG: aminotransferase class IV [Microthrixaceae bacterium]
MSGDDVADAKVWIGAGTAGRLVAAGEAHVAYDDHGVTVGDGVFETIKLDGEPFALWRHLVRLRSSAATMRIPYPGDDTVNDAIDAVVRSLAPTARQGFLRVTLTAGPGPLGSNRTTMTPTLVVALRSGNVRTDPTDVWIAPWTRNERGALVGVKSTSYGENVLALAHAAEAGASEALFANTRGELCEGTGSNVFVVLDDRLVTPPITAGCLAGITRALLLEAGSGTEATVPMHRLDEVTEAFLVSTAREVQPIVRLGGRVLSRCPGPHTITATESWARIASHSDP